MSSKFIIYIFCLTF